MAGLAGQSQWIVGIATVIFDVDVGQKINNLVPSDALSEEEQKAVAFHAFPDSMSMELHSRSSVRDSSFFFRIKRQLTEQPPNAAQNSDQRFLYGFVFCRQRQDESLRRGGEQNSVVVLSSQPYSSALMPLSQIAGPLYFNQGPAALQQVYQQVQCWPCPVPGLLLQLPVAMSTIPARLPASRTFPPPAPDLEQSSLASSSSLAHPLHRRTSIGYMHRTRSTDSGGSARNSPHGSRVGLAELQASPAASGRPSRTFSDELPPPAAAAAAAGPPSLQIPSSSVYMLRDAQVESPVQMRPPSFDSPSSAAAALADAPGEAQNAPLAAISTAAVRRSSSLKRSSSSGLEEMAGVFSEVDVYTPLAEQLHCLWQLWELLLTCQPLLVVAPTPCAASSCVAALTSLLAPMPYAADFRPYYTIHDASFRHLAVGELPSPCSTSLPCLLGVTNLFFVKALQQWPNILAVGRKEAPGGQWGASGSAPGGGSLLSPSTAVKALKKRQQGPLQLLGEHTQALWSSYKAVCKPDQGLLSRLVQPKATDGKAKLQRAAVVNSTAIRRHFAELTTAFLAPFAQYLEPAAGPAGARLPRWDPGAFLFSLHTRQHDPVLLERLGGNKAAAVTLYERFVRSANFSSWFEARRRPLEHLVEKEPPPGMDAFASAVQHMDEVQLLQAFFSLEAQLQAAMAAAAAPTTTTITPAQEHHHHSSSSSSGSGADEALALALQRLRRQASALFCALPEDLQQTLASSPSRRALLRSLHLDGGLDPMLARLVARLQSDVAGEVADG